MGHKWCISCKDLRRHTCRLLEEKGLLASKTSGLDDAEDGGLKTVMACIIFFCNDAIMKDRAPRIKSRKEFSTLIINDWQKEAVEILFGKDIKAVIINDERFRILLTAGRELRPKIDFCN